jgi:hypothetical protein
MLQKRRLREKSKVDEEKARMRFFAQGLTTIDKSHPNRLEMVKRQRVELANSFNAGQNLTDTEAMVAEYAEALRAEHAGAISDECLKPDVVFFCLPLQYYV